MQEDRGYRATMKKNCHRFTLKLNWVTICCFFYVILLYFLSIFIWSQNRSEEFTAYKYILSINGTKLFASIVLSITMWIIISNRYYRANTFSSQVLLLISLLYFLPGVVLCGTLDFEWAYLIEYYIYFVVMILIDKVCPYPRKSFLAFQKGSLAFLQKILIVCSFIVPLFLMIYYRSSFTLSSILLTLNDTYGVRTAAKEANTSWMILAIEYWGAYFSCFMITYSLRNKKRILAIMYILFVLFYFTLQGNRIFVFFIGIAILIGLFDFDSRTIIFGFLILMVLQIFEFFLVSDKSSIGLVTNMYRRYSIVPNIISTQYFDFFKSNSPDWLTGTFTGISNLLGIESEYGNKIGTLIGSKYYGWNMNANTGLFGGAIFEFGELGILIDPIMFVLVLRFIEKILFKYNVDNVELKFITAAIYASLAINLTTIWVGMFRLTPTLLFIFSCMAFCHGVTTNKNKISS